MIDADKILHVLAAMQKDIKSLQDGQTALRADAKLTQSELQNLDLKVEVFHTEQTKANQEILSTLTEIVEVNAQHTEKRLTRIEKHLTLPPRE